MSRRWHRQRELFEAASKLGAQERRALLDEACAEDPSLRRTLEELLREHDEEGDPIGEVLRATAEATVAPQASAPPQRIGPYRILRRIGEGGMGVVFEAEQDNPRRRVAVKVIRGGPFVDATRLRMFQREAQSLGRLKHPNIAAIHQAGSTERSSSA